MSFQRTTALSALFLLALASPTAAARDESPESWFATQVAELANPDLSTTYDFFGCAVAVSGNTAVVGADAADVLGSVNVGLAYVFERDLGGTGQWGQAARLSPSGSAADELGCAVAIAGDLAMVGARSVQLGGLNDVGAAYVFARDQGGAGV